MVATRVVRTLVLLSLVVLATPFVLAQQTGSVHGTVLASDGSALPGVTVEARSNALPQPRVTTSDENGVYRLPALQPGVYTLTYTLSGMQTVNRKAEVILSQDLPLDVKLDVAGVSETVTVVAQASLVDKESTAIQTGFSNEQIRALPITQDYKDIQKLVPGVQVSQDEFRGPSGGGSGQDNVYLFDGVNVTMPLFGIQVGDPATHDISQVSVVKGGAKAVDFERAGGFQIDTVSKSGTSKYSGEVGYQILKHSFVADQATTSNAKYSQDRDWTTVSVGGPILSDKLFFYTSYYRPIYTKSNQSNLYGDLPEFRDYRNEGFVKLTYTPTASMLINGSYRSSHHRKTGASFTSTQAPTTGAGSTSDLKIGSLEGSWVVNNRSLATFKYFDFKSPGGGGADTLSDAAVSIAAGAKLPINDLGTAGRLIVPTANAGNTAFVQPYIDKYGYLQDGVKKGGGTVGFGQFAADNDDFFRKSGQIGYNITFGSKATHDLHFGYQRYTDSEDRFQSSNGWGVITIPGGATTAQGGVNCPAAACGTAKPAFFIANFSPQTTGQIPTIHSEIKTQNIEINDTIALSNWTFNVGLLASSDTLYGQGLAKADNIAGFVKSPGTKYKMHETPFHDMLQPRLGTTWAYNGQDTVYVSYARYNPAANSDARAASWDRNLVADINAYFDQNGVLIGIDPVRSSSGKLFVDGIEPRVTN
ncbi:MAG TPA: TonB-dependent receptor, partial [Thermoanaerobaculia bacterium]|nr:TonB-dependent receptor [Thermoanaerobaculia bacterium]